MWGWVGERHGDVRKSYPLRGKAEGGCGEELLERGPGWGQHLEC